MYQGKFSTNTQTKQGNKAPQRSSRTASGPKSPNAAAPQANTPSGKPVHPASRKAKSSRVGAVVFYSILLLLIAAFFVGMIFVMDALRSWLVKFEASQPTNKCQEIFSQLFAYPDWQQIYELAAQTEGQDITAEEYASYMELTTGNAKLNFIETSAGLSGNKKYIVRNGSEKVATFTLTNHLPDGDIPDWQLDEVEIFYTCDKYVTINATPDCTVKVNGEALTQDDILSTISTKAENYIPEGVHGYQMNRYYVDGLLLEPQVEVLDAQGKAVEMTYDSSLCTYTQSLPSQEVTDGQKQLLTDAAQAYCKYMIGAIGKFGLRKHFNSDSDIYKTIIANDTWMQSYASYELGEAVVSDFYGYSDQLFSARISMTLKVTRGNGTEKEYPLDNTFFMETTDGEDWLVTEMINANAQDTVTMVRLTYMVDSTILDSGLVDANSTTLTPPAMDTVPEGKTFAGWFTQTVDETGASVMELAFLPGEDGKVSLSSDTILEPMTLYALFK